MGMIKDNLWHKKAVCNWNDSIEPIAYIVSYQTKENYPIQLLIFNMCSTQWSGMNYSEWKSINNAVSYWSKYFKWKIMISVYERGIGLATNYALQTMKWHH